MSSIEQTISDLKSLEAAGEAALNAALSRLSPAERDAYWASVRRCYNAPYNDAPAKARAALWPREGGPQLRAG
ncbi:hypothetical protein [Methylobacterium nodulans]|uniref:Uncharacterized protein n=1 Tax=Methylobacterium nodulans (strain LMG 21967 / CNCM I-2342 / ORS 2060) TaxID=460265 RepID=B8IL64_METNO|nr:hypothetical protein [Methylobacterium nodulans]ACL58252.1 conserved hypothetical protein [Methylobacterium nodulans ORS 2060]